MVPSALKCSISALFVFFMLLSFFFFVGSYFYVVRKEVDGGDCDSEVADTTNKCSVFVAAQILHPTSSTLHIVLLFQCTLFVSPFMCVFVCPCLFLVTKLKRVCLCLASVCMHHWICVCVSQREVTHETVALLFFHLPQCSGLSWQGSCGYQSLENKAVRSY